MTYIINYERAATADIRYRSVRLKNLKSTMVSVGIITLSLAVNVFVIIFKTIPRVIRYIIYIEFILNNTNCNILRITLNLLEDIETLFDELMDNI